MQKVIFPARRFRHPNRNAILENLPPENRMQVFPNCVTPHFDNTGVLEKKTQEYHYYHTPQSCFSLSRQATELFYAPITNPGKTFRSGISNTSLNPMACFTAFQALSISATSLYQAPRIGDLIVESGQIESIIHQGSQPASGVRVLSCDRCTATISSYLAVYSSRGLFSIDSLTYTPSLFGTEFQALFVLVGGDDLHKLGYHLQTIVGPCRDDREVVCLVQGVL